ncbi:unnamed protein product [Spodoptera littoralis]|uniref:Uncharacterized protein n=1 Tax=Spodoptera littoralis TaxID=7109 RepID=A0A9P0I509_SPOLI|nr:unnamed protein product [Spodoptera littoralis]CAH1639961.1 unnamed protein product [Spodoptera littoralis]
MASSKDNNSNNEAQESLLYSARHGELSVVKAMLEAKDEGKLTLDINCKGKNKTNLGWTPLHLATYFGHKDVVEALLEAGANVDEVNDTGDSALHKASFIGNELSSPNPPNINCVDAQGNTCLHCAAYRGHTRLAVLLLQNGVDTTLRNNSGQLAIDMAKDTEMREVLSVRPVQRLQRTAARFEGPLLKRSRFLGWRPVWAARGGPHWRARKYLDAAALSASHTDPAAILLRFSDGDTHRLAVQAERDVPACRQRFQHVCGTGSEALSALRHCAALVAQARDADSARLSRESCAPWHGKRHSECGVVILCDKTPTNEEQEERYLRRLSGSSGSPVSLHTAVSAASSRGTLVSQGGHVYRNARPYRKNTHPSPVAKQA